MCKFAIVEDKPANQRRLTGLLKSVREHAEVHNFYNVPDAANAFDETGYDLVCLDLELPPDRRGGFKLLTRIAANNTRHGRVTPVLVVSSLDPHGEHDYAEIATNMGAFDYLPSDCGDEAFKRHVEFILRHHRRERYNLVGYGSSDRFIETQEGRHYVKLTMVGRDMLDLLWFRRLASNPMVKITELAECTPGNTDDANNVNTQIARIRKAIREAVPAANPIMTEINAGYYWRSEPLSDC
jgi:DNA-binding response OmpR family regulator